MNGFSAAKAALIALVAMCVLSASGRSLLTMFTGISTYFAACGTFCGCGVPQSLLTDDAGKPLPLVGLNMHYQSTPTSALTTGEYANGANCGRVIKFTAGNACTGGQFMGYRACIKGSTSGLQNYDKAPDAIAKEGKVLYAVVADSCDGANYACRISRYHLNILQSYLVSVFGSIANWNNRFVSWEYVDTPIPGLSMTKFRFAWGPGASKYYLPLIISNTYAGISAVDVLLTNGQYAKGIPNGPEGSQWKVAPQVPYKFDAQKRIQVRITSHNGSVASPYGGWWVPLPSGTQQNVVTITGVHA